MNIGILEDDREMAVWLRAALEQEKHRCLVFPSAAKLMTQEQRLRLDLLILDWELPDSDGPTVLNWFRNHYGWTIPVLFLTVRGRSADVAAMLNQGADDYIAKPVDPRELLARVNALWRRYSAVDHEKDRIEVGEFLIDYYHKRLLRNGEEIRLTTKEFEVSAILLANLGRTIARPEILRRVWGYECKLSTRTVDTHISRLRKKLDLVPERGWRLASVYRNGYRLTRHEEGAAGDEDAGSEDAQEPVKVRAGARR